MNEKNCILIISGVYLWLYGVKGVMREQTTTGVLCLKIIIQLLKRGQRRKLGLLFIRLYPIVSPNFADAKADLYNTTNEN